MFSTPPLLFSPPPHGPAHSPFSLLFATPGAPHSLPCRPTHFYRYLSLFSFVSRPLIVVWNDAHMIPTFSMALRPVRERLAFVRGRAGFGDGKGRTNGLRWRLLQQATPNPTSRTSKSAHERQHTSRGPGSPPRAPSNAANPAPLIRRISFHTRRPFAETATPTVRRGEAEDSHS